MGSLTFTRVGEARTKRLSYLSKKYIICFADPDVSKAAKDLVTDSEPGLSYLHQGWRSNKYIFCFADPGVSKAAKGLATDSESGLSYLCFTGLGVSKAAKVFN